MGTFRGHALPGSFLVVFAIWWTTQITKRLLICQRKRIPFYSTATYPCFCGKCLSWPVEGLVKVALTSLGMVLELLSSTDFGQANTVLYINDIQHFTMYLFFCLSGIIDILQRHYSLIPRGLDYLTLALAFAVEAVVFYFHIQGRSPLEMRVHTLLLYTVIACVVAVLMEMMYVETGLVAYWKAYCVLLQGTWFIQTGFILHNPIYGSKKWDEYTDEQLMLTSVLFCWHCGLVLVGLAVVIGLWRLLVLICCYPDAGDPEWQMTHKLANFRRDATLVACQGTNFNQPDDCSTAGSTQTLLLMSDTEESDNSVELNCTSD